MVCETPSMTLIVEIKTLFFLRRIPQNKVVII